MALKSLTGFGRSDLETPSARFSLEIKSLNHRFLLVDLRLPHSLGSFEGAIRNSLSSTFSRGKLTLNINQELIGEKEGVGHSSLVFDRVSAELLLKELNELDPNLTLKDVIQIPGIIRKEEHSIFGKEFEQEVIKAVKLAAQGCLKFREKEGEVLKFHLEEHLKEIEEIVLHLKSLTEEWRSDFESRFRKRLTEFSEGPFSEERILTEVAIFSEKSQVDEELERLSSHLKQFSEFLEEDEPVGRKLDFLTQEIHREIHTLSSKSTVPGITLYIIKAKDLLEKIREQIQNVE